MIPYNQTGSNILGEHCIACNLRWDWSDYCQVVKEGQEWQDICRDMQKPCFENRDADFAASAVSKGALIYDESDRFTYLSRCKLVKPLNLPEVNGWLWLNRNGTFYTAVCVACKRSDYMKKDLEQGEFTYWCVHLGIDL